MVTVTNSGINTTYKQTVLDEHYAPSLISRMVSLDVKHLVSMNATVVQSLTCITFIESETIATLKMWPTPGRPDGRPTSQTKTLELHRLTVFSSNSKHWFTTSFLWRKVSESDGRSVSFHVSQKGILQCTDKSRFHVFVRASTYSSRAGAMSVAVAEAP